MVDAAAFERRGIPAAVIGLAQLLDTVGRATAKALDMSDLQFVHVPGDLHHALDYIPDDSPFWVECVDAIVPLILNALTQTVR